MCAGPSRESRAAHLEPVDGDGNGDSEREGRDGVAGWVTRTFVASCVPQRLMSSVLCLCTIKCVVLQRRERRENNPVSLGTCRTKQNDISTQVAPQTTTKEVQSPAPAPVPSSPNITIRGNKQASHTTHELIVPEKPNPEPNTTTHEEAILLVDDNEINLRILVTCIKRLKLKDVTLLTTSNGREALDKFIAATNANIYISIIFMDISMSIMDGFRSTREIPAFERERGGGGGGVAGAKRSQIVALTGLASAEAVKEVEASGFDSYLRKPVNLGTIREVLAAARTN